MGPPLEVAMALRGTISSMRSVIIIFAATYEDYENVGRKD
jgi:hypothetical protein